MNTQGKSPQQWAEYLPEPIRTEFLENIDLKYARYIHFTCSLASCVYSSFDWESTKQGMKYWLLIFNKAKNGQFPKPIPTFEKMDSYEKEVLKNTYDALDFGSQANKKPINKMTSLDWFWDKIKSHFEHDGDLLETAAFTFSIAKEKEKKQMIQFGESVCQDGFEEYVAETFDKTYGGDK